MIAQDNGEVLITNDGATILERMQVKQPAAKMLVELAKAQDVQAGDGTTTVTVICGSLLRKCMNLLQIGIHPTIVSDAYYAASKKAEEILLEMSQPVDLSDRCPPAPSPAPPPPLPQHALAAPSRGAASRGHVSWMSGHAG